MIYTKYNLHFRLNNLVFINCITFIKSYKTRLTFIFTQIFFAVKLIINDLLRFPYFPYMEYLFRISYF